MKQTKTKLLCLILTALMLLSGLTACGKDKEGKDSNLIKLGDYELLYKGACIMEDSDGNDAIVLTLDFTNNSKENASYLWSVDETVMQNGVELEPASIITDYENLETVVSDQFTDVAPGATLEVRTAFVLKDTTSEVKATFEEFLGSKKGTITVDPATLSRETVSHTEPETTNTTGDTLLDWWNGEWYGWWKMSGCYGDYESMEGDWWDVCGVIDLDTDYTGTIELWDEDYTRSDPMASAQVSLSEAGTGEHGTVMSEGGWFTNVTLEHADWIVDPGLLDYDDMICISGDYEDGDDEFHYDIYLRPWGLYWKDMEEDAYPYRYTDWYLPLIDAGKSMPDAIGEGVSEGNAPTNQTNAAAPGGNGIVTEVKQALAQSGRELVQKEGVYQIGPEAMEILQEVLCGKVNKSLVATLNKLGSKSIGLCGIDGGLMTARAAEGCTGELVRVDSTILETFLAQDYTPVVAAVAQGADGGETVYSVSANLTAARLAVALKAEKLIHLVESTKLLRDPAAPEAPIPELGLSQVPAMIRSGVIPPEMALKANCSVEAVRSGVRSATLLDGSVPHAILLELLSDEGIGTMLTH